MRVTLIHNPGSGDDAQPDAEGLVALIRSAGHEVTYWSSHTDDWIAALAEPTELLAIAGGDGTIADVAKHLIGRRVPIALLPMGTANNISRTLGVTELPLEHQVATWHTARRAPFDVGLAVGPWGSRYFLEGVGAGLFTRTMAKAKASPLLARLNRAHAKIAHALQMLKDGLHSAQSIGVRATLDGHDISGSYILFEAMNIQYIGPNLYLAPHCHPGDGVFDVVLATDSERGPLEHYLSSWQNGWPHRPEFLSYRGKELKIEWTGYPLHIDDELEPDLASSSMPANVEVKIAGYALEFLVPA
jgi:diacylglycerol kinase family enzyme